MKLSRIKLINLRIIRNSKGNIMKYLDKSNPNFKSFGEVYFSEIKKNMSKGWILHKKSSCFLAVPFGKVKFTFSEKLKSKKKIIIIGSKNYKLIFLPPKIWFKFTSITTKSLVVNTINNVHDDSETLKFPIT